MGSGIYEYKYPDGAHARWVRLPDGTIEYSLNDDWKLKLTNATWTEIVRAMSRKRSPVRTDPTVFGEIVGWRVWEVEGDHLKSLFHHLLWAPGAPVTGHVGGDYEGGGIYAFRDKAHALTVLAKCKAPAVLGTVFLAGEIVEHEDGYRASFAEVRSIDMATDAGTASRMPALRLRYGVEGEGTEAIARSLPRKLRPFFLGVIGALMFGSLIVSIDLWTHVLFVRSPVGSRISIAQQLSDGRYVIASCKLVSPDVCVLDERK